MRRSLPYVCFFLFVGLAVGVSASDYILWGRFKREINSRNQNLSQHNFDLTWYNSKQPASNRTGSQWNNPRDSYNHGYSLNPNDLTLIDNNRPQNTYGPNTYPNTYNVQPPAWNGPNQQRNNPNDQFYPGNNPRDRQWNNPNDQYYQRNNPQDVGWKPQSTSGYNTNVNGYNSGSSVFNGTRSQLINPAPQRNNPSGSNYQGNLNYLYNPKQISAKPQNTSWYNTNPNGQNTKPTYGQEWNNLGNQYYPVPNDLNRNRYKRSVNNRYYNASSYHRDPYLHSSNKPLWNSTNPYGNWTQYNNRSRWTREVTRDSITHDVSLDHLNYLKRVLLAQNCSNLEWNKPGGHWPVNNQNNETYHNMVPKNGDFPRHQHRHRHHHHISGPPPPQFGSPSPLRPPPTLRPPPPVGPPPPIRPPPPIDSTGSNGNVINGTNPWVPETGSGLNGTNVNNTYPWGPELPDIDNRDEFVSTPVPQ